MAITPKTMTSSVAMSGWTTESVPTRKARIWKMNPRIMLAIPKNQTGRLIRYPTRWMLKLSFSGAEAAAWRSAPLRPWR